MKLWLLKPVKDLDDGNDPWYTTYDKYQAFVIRANSECDAREIANKKGDQENHEIDNVLPWIDAKYSTCELLLCEGECGVIVAEYHSS